MASLPGFRSFHQAAADKQDGALKASTIHLEQKTKAHEPFTIGGAEGGCLGVPSTLQAQDPSSNRNTTDDSIEAAAVPTTDNAESQVTSTLDAGDSSLSASSVLSTQQKQASMASMLGRPGDGSLGTTADQAPQVLELPANNITVDASSHGSKALSNDGPEPEPLFAEPTSLHITASSQSFNPKAVPDLEDYSKLYPSGYKLTEPEPDSHPAPELPVVSANTIASVIFITIRVARFLLPSAMPSAVLLFILNLVFVSTNPGIMAGSAAFWFSALTGLASVLFLLGSSAHTIIKDDKVKFNNKILLDFSKLNAASYLFVLGSGGHTTEMIALVKLSQKPYHHTHRRYLITAGDNHSRNQANKLESEMAKNHPDGSAGTSDMVTVTRARSVHQSYITSVITSLKCFLEITNALMSIPVARMGHPGAKDFRFPHVIVTNGPGTGLIVGLVAFFLKVLHVVPRDRLKVVFVETWARTHSLGLTGKLFYLTQIADLFVVQSEDLAKAINKPCIGNVNKKWADLVNAAPKHGHGAEQGAE